MRLTPGQTIETPSGLVAVAGCDRWPATEVSTGALASTVDDAGATRFFRLGAGEWSEVWHG